MGFSKQEHWSGLPFPSPGNLPKPGIEPKSPRLQVDFLLSELPGNVDSCNCHLRIQLQHSRESPSAASLSSDPHSVPSPGNYSFVFCSYAFAFFRMSYKWNKAVIFWDWILSLSQTHLRFIQVGVCIIVHSFLLLSGILLCGYSTV